MDKLKHILQQNPNFGINHEPLDEILFETCNHTKFDNDLPVKVVDLQKVL
jgi:hypothetical protein